MRGGPATAPLARLRVALGALHTVVRESGMRRGRGGGEARVLSVGEDRSWQALRKRLDGVQELQLTRPSVPRGLGGGPRPRAQDKPSELQCLLH